ncbi:hypothetical protein BS50DRAFT_389044 [Corynespora cassiicola Philippines]|uniref:Uncharacterized protein n=1 Tax=Corynespora cassiicola Philippines TaxID=1448308 RepID=A0A2T2NPK4_CORCC|nr:hypothetical protein BS50DRAFT_389044 [Corynespora cassiicola Philippines]
MQNPESDSELDVVVIGAPDRRGFGWAYHGSLLALPALLYSLPGCLMIEAFAG